MNFLAAYSKELLEQRRTHKLLIAMIVLVLFGMTSPLIAKMTPQLMQLVPGGEAFSALIPAPAIQDAVAQYLKNITQFGILLALVFAMGSVAGEKDKGTAAMILSKPMSKAGFLTAKFAAMGTTFILAILTAGIACYYYTFFLFGELNILNWITANGLLILYLLVFVAITLFFSTLTRTQYIAIGASFGVLIVFGILSSIPGIAVFLPDALLSNASLIMSDLPVTSWSSLWVSFGLVACSLIGSWLVFRQQEL